MFVLAIDCGTQSMRGMVFDQKGQLLSIAKKAYNPYVAPQPGYAEQDVEVYEEAMSEIIDQMNHEYPQIMSEVKSLVLTTQRDMAVFVDKEGRPLRHAIIWADQRRIHTAKPMSLLHNLMFGVIGMKVTADDLSCNCKAHWVQDHQPEIWEKTHKYLQLSAYLNHQLTGSFKDGIASQIGHVPFSYKHFRWEHPRSLKHDIFHIDNKKLCDLVPTTEVIGYVSPSAAAKYHLPEGLPVMAAGSDKGCETVGVGCTSDESIAISLGSQATIQTTTNRYYETMMFIPPFQAVIPGYYNPEIQIYRGYWMISWFLKEFAAKEVRKAEELGVSPEQLLDQELLKVRPGSDGLILQPYWGAGVKKHEAKGAIIGFSDQHTRIHIYRAIIEGIGYALYEGMLAIERRSGKKIKKIMISGGGATSDVICQITADIFNLPVHRVQTNETSGLGASMAGYVGLGVHKDFEAATKAMVHPSEPFYPNPENVQIYQELFHKTYKKIYPRLKRIYKNYPKW